MAMTGHKSVQTAVGYYHAGEVKKSKAARLLDVEERASKQGPASEQKG
jgi:hypothetical protein